MSSPWSHGHHRWVQCFVPDGLLDELPRPTQIGATRVAGLDLDSARIRAALAAVLALSPAPAFTVADLAAKVADMTGHTDYTPRQAAYDLRKFRGKDLVTKPGLTRRYQGPLDAARIIAALLALRDHVIAPILAGVRSPRRGRRPTTWTTIDRDCETLRIGMHALLDHLGISIHAPRHRQHLVDRIPASGWLANLLMMRGLWLGETGRSSRKQYPGESSRKVGRAGPRLGLPVEALFDQRRQRGGYVAQGRGSLVQMLLPKN